MDGRGLIGEEKTLDIYTTYLYQRHPQKTQQHPVCKKVLSDKTKLEMIMYALLFGRGFRFSYCVRQKHELFCWPQLFGVHLLRIT